MSYEHTNRHELHTNTHESQRQFVKIRVPIRENSCRNNNSFDTLLKRISPTLKRITYKLNGHFSFFNDEDLFQEALLHLWRDFQAGKLEDKTDSYILQGCYFHLKNYLRKVKVKTNLVSLDALINEEGMDLEEKLSLGNPESYFDSLNRDSLIERIQNNGLTKREKEVFSLYLEGLTVREIGKRLSISHVRVVKLMGRIRHKSKPYTQEGCL